MIEFAVARGGKNGPKIESGLFGSNFLFDQDKLIKGTFDRAVDELNIQTLRYPGGAITEEKFDVTAPDKTTSEDGSTLVPLSDFLAYCLTKRVDPQLVIPTSKLLLATSDASGARMLNIGAIEEIRIFIRDVLSGVYGDVDIHTFEIGNEWYTRDLSAIEYGKIASKLGSIIQSEIDKISNIKENNWEQPKIAVQSGKNSTENEEIISQFDAEEKSAVDTIITHFYPWNFEGIGKHIDKFKYLTAWEETPGFGELEVFISEWNVGTYSWKQAIRKFESETDSNFNPNNDEHQSVVNEIYTTIVKEHDYGLAHARVILETITQFALHGVDNSTIWPIQQNTKSDLAGKEGVYELTVAGTAYSLISNSIMNLNFMPLDFTSEKATTYAFSSDEQIVLFVSSATLESQDFSINVSNFISEVHQVNGTLLTVYDDPSTADIDEGDPLYAEALPLVMPLNVNVDSKTGMLEFTLKSYEFARIVFNFTKDSEKLEYIYGTERRDRLIGTEENDVIYGYQSGDKISGGNAKDTIFAGFGNDLVYGGNGFDIVKGGRGNDTVIGGRGADSIYGGDGSDQLSGGVGNDVLFGGKNNDTIKGGTGDDIINGNGGNDVLFGGRGGDVFIFGQASGRDKIVDFDPNEDILRFIGWQYTDFTFTENGGDLEIQFGDNFRVQIKGLGFSDIEYDVFSFL